MLIARLPKFKSGFASCDGAHCLYAGFRCIYEEHHMVLPCTSHHSWSTPSSTSNLDIEIALQGAVFVLAWDFFYDQADQTQRLGGPVALWLGTRSP